MSGAAIRNIGLISKTVWLEFLRRKDFYVVVLFMGLFVIGVVVTRIIGVDSAKTAEFLMSFGLSASATLAAILVATLAARQLPNEFEKRTLYPLLAKPVSRAEFLMGKIFAVVSISALTMIVLVAICWISTPKSPAQQPLALAQMIGLQIVGLSLLGLLSMTISLFCPAVVAGLLALVLYFLGTSIVNGLNAIATKLLGESGNLLGAALSVVPDFSAFNHVDRYVSGQAPMSAESFLAIVAYGALSFGFYAIVAAWSFERKAI